MQHRARGFQITKSCPSVVHNIFRHFAFFVSFVGSSTYTRGNGSAADDQYLVVGTPRSSLFPLWLVGGEGGGCRLGPARAEPPAHPGRTVPLRHYDFRLKKSCPLSSNATPWHWAHCGFVLTWANDRCDGVREQRWVEGRWVYGCEGGSALLWWAQWGYADLCN